MVVLNSPMTNRNVIRKIYTHVLSFMLHENYSIIHYILFGWVMSIHFVYHQRPQSLTLLSVSWFKDSTLKNK